MSDYYEAEVVIGIEDIAIQELRQINKIDKQSIQQWRDGFLRFRYSGNLKELTALRSIIAIYQIHQFDIPRPKALLGHQHLSRLINAISTIRHHSKFESLSIGAAGAESSVMQRINQELAQQLNLIVEETEKGDLYLRLIPNRKQSNWEVLIRLTQRPLSTRTWRVENMPGALNATVAYAMTQLSSSATGNVVNLCSGTGTILVEHAQFTTQSTLIGIEKDCSILEKAQINIQKSQTSQYIQCIQADAMQTPLPSGFADLIYADLPFGQSIGTHDENSYLYPAIVEEAYRIAKIGTRFILITHEIQLMEAVLRQSKWHTIDIRKINLSGLHPRIFVLERK